MRILSRQTFLWIGRILYVAVILWWPAIWRDPIYTPRHARMSGQELRLADGAPPRSEDERALAIFWAWEHRQLVQTRWVVGPFIGLRSGFYGIDRTGWRQTILVLICIWLLFGVLLARESDTTAPKGKLEAIATTPLWQLFRRLRQQN